MEQFKRLSRSEMKKINAGVYTPACFTSAVACDAPGGGGHCSNAAEGVDCYCVGTDGQTIDNLQCKVGGGTNP